MAKIYNYIDKKGIPFKKLAIFSIKIQEDDILNRLNIESDETTDKSNYIEKDKTLTAMAAALTQLNKEQQVCVTLFYLEKKSYQEIAEQTKFSLLQVKSHIQNGKRNLKLLMEK